MPSKPMTASYVLTAALSGFFTGVLAGLVGLGGAEERIPFILYALKEPLYDMVVANLVISFATSGLNFALRANEGLLPTPALIISLVMIVGSLPGAFLGASLSHRISDRKLKAFIAVVLGLVVARLSADFIAGTSPTTSTVGPYLEFPLAVVFGFLIGIIGGGVGVAGGEYRIPVLIFMFGFPIKIAGTASQLVSLPTILMALLRHTNMGFLSKRSLVVAALMGIPSVIGVIVSLRILLASGEEIIRLVFALLLTYTIVRLLLELRPNKKPTSIQKARALA